MSTYQIAEFSLEQRMKAALQMLVPLPERPWGLVSELAEQYNVSRTRLYEIRDQAKAALESALEPGQAGRPLAVSTLRVDKALIDRTIALMPVLTGSVRQIQLGLSTILGVERSVGYVSERLQTAGEQASLYNRSMRIPLPVLGEADEIFQGRQPCLTVVDGRSFLVLNLSASESRDGVSWGVTYLDLLAQGIEFHDLACDGGTGLRAGVREAELAIPLRPDLFHLMQEAHCLSRRLERAAYAAMTTAERARRIDRQQRGLLKRRGAPLKATLPLPQAASQEAIAITTLDGFTWLLGEIRQALQPFSSDGRLLDISATKATLATALDLLKMFNHPAITAFAVALQDKLPELLAPLAWLSQQLSSFLTPFSSPTQTFLLWLAQAPNLWADLRETDLPPEQRSLLQPLADTLALFHRSSSLAESLHSWLRPYLQIHKGMPDWLLPLLQLFWNHHPFQRGKRAGHTPLQLAGVPDAPSLTQLFAQLFFPPPSTQPA